MIVSSSIVSQSILFKLVCITCALVPLILRDALQVTSQAADEAMAKILKLAYELTGNITVGYVT